jgi:hypothetical protein
MDFDTRSQYFASQSFRVEFSCRELVFEGFV